MKTQIVPYNYNDDLKNLAMDTAGVVIGIEEMSITYTQLPDTNSSSEDYQYLTITTKMVYSVDKKDADNQEGYYFDISIPEGKHWSIDDGSELQALIDDFKYRLYTTIKQ